jgi:bacillithiol biosynthesis deacetylase BshB1
MGRSTLAESLSELLLPPTEPLDYLVVAPHPDDAELGVGGTIPLLLAEQAKVGVLDLTNGEPTPFGSLEIRLRETEAATAVLGLTWRGNLGLPNRSLEATLPARAKLASAFRLLRPRILFAPYWEDAHPDHVAASALIDAARFWSKLSKTDMPGQPHFPQRIIYYFTVHLRIHPPTSAVIDITGTIEKKMQAIACYQSQFVQGRSIVPPTPLDDIRDRARYWGWSIGMGFGEPFVCREPVGLRSLRDLT